MEMGPSGEGEDEAEVAVPIRMRAERGPSSLLIWVPAVFFAVLACGVMLEGLLQTDGRIFLGAVWGGMAAAIGMCVRRKPRYLRELEISGGVCRGRDWKRREVVFLAGDVDVLSAEGTVSLVSLTFERWGWMQFRVGKQWVAIKLPSAGVKELFWRVWRRLPNAVGLAGDHQIELPRIEGAGDAGAWLGRVRENCRRELGRQVRYFLFVGGVGAVAGVGLVMTGIGLGLKEMKWKLGTEAEVWGVTILGVAGAFLGMARARWLLLRRTLAAVDAVGQKG